MNEKEIREILEKLLADNLSDDQEGSIWSKSKYEPYTSLDYVRDFLQTNINYTQNEIIKLWNAKRPTVDEIIKTIKNLPSWHFLEGYVGSHPNISLNSFAKELAAAIYRLGDNNDPKTDNKSGTVA